MHFVYPLSWWLVLVVAAAIAALIYAQYRRPLAPLTVGQRTLLVVCRTVVLGALVIFLFRPTVASPPRNDRMAVVPVLVDRSKSMRVNDADGQPRLSRAVSLLTGQLITELSKSFTPELYGVGESLEPTAVEGIRADAPKSDLRGALAAVRDRYRGQHVAGIVLLSDGADTNSADGDDSSAGPPIFAVGLGSPEGVPDREIAGITAGEQHLDRASIDLQVTAATSGFGRAPFQLRLLANASEIERRRVVPAAAGGPATEVFTVAPDSTKPTVYTAEIVADPAEAVVENNSRSVLVNPVGRRRRLLIVEGAPGYEHGFIKRAWASDDSLEVDAVGRKGKNADGHDTFFVQADASRTGALSGGFPARREDLYVYDAVVLANVEGDLLTRAQLTMLAEFVSERGGGLLVLGSRSFTPSGLSGTALEEALPIQLSDRREGVTTAVADREAALYKVVVTSEGEGHPVMRIGDTSNDSRRLWAAMPPLASVSPLGGPRPGATVLAVTSGATGGTYPLIAVQRYGRGRSMTFTGEASWRWKMLLPSSDRSFDRFWRQAARWIAGPAPDPVMVTAPDNASPGNVPIVVDVRDGQFAAVNDAVVAATVTSPDGENHSVSWRPATDGRYTADVPALAPGLYHVAVEARRGRDALGAADQWLYVGGVDREFVDPRLNESWLRRVARASGGRYVRAADAAQIVGWLKETTPLESPPERRDLWHEPSAFMLVVVGLSVEWIARRRWGLR